MAIYVRIYRCPECLHKWRSRSPRAEYETDCPNCGEHFGPLPDRIAAPAIIGTKAKAVDAAYDIVSEDYGLTNLRDNAKEGESSVILPTSGSAEMAQMAAAMAAIPDNNQAKQAGGFMWGGAKSAGPIQFPAAGGAMGAAKVGAMVANAEGRNPLQLLHQSRPKLQPIPLNKGSR